MNLDDKEVSRLIAIQLGCKPIWYKPYNDYICNCEGMQHAIDSQCSRLVDYSEHREAYKL